MTDRSDAGEGSEGTPPRTTHDEARNFSAVKRQRNKGTTGGWRLAGRRTLELRNLSPRNNTTYGHLDEEAVSFQGEVGCEMEASDDSQTSARCADENANKRQ
eukprot:1177867-Prorocentrum_minimum.AAC.2